MEFFFTDTDDIPILGKDACQSMNLLRRVHVVGVTSHSKCITKANLLTEYSDVFSGVGMFEKEYDIEVDPNVRPVIQAPRKLPYAKYDQLKETIAKLEEEEINASVDKPTDWVHNLVITEKRNGSLRICLDPRCNTVFISDKINTRGCSIDRSVQRRRFVGFVEMPSVT